MTVSYNASVSTSSLWNVKRLLLRWRGSVWQCVWHELFLWTFIYGILSVSYRYAMNGDQRVIFEKTTIFCNKFTEWIPVTFLLGFYVTFIVGRWWSVFSNIAFPDEFALALSTMIKPDDTSDKVRCLRRTTTRFLVLTQVLALRQISTAVFKRFPTFDHLLYAGILNQDELEHMYRVPVGEDHRYWIPIRWIIRLLVNALDEGVISTEVQLLALIERIDDFRLKTHRLLCYDWISIPLVYTQVVNLAVRSYFIVCLMARQFLHVSRDSDSSEPEFDMYIPLFTLLQFICFVGWLKVAEVLINPMGEDDEDFDLNYILDRNLKYGLTIVDEDHATVPNLTRDLFWSTDVPVLNHTVASQDLKVTPPQPSTNNVKISQQDAKIIHSVASSRASSRMGSRSIASTAPKAAAPSALEPATASPRQLKRTLRQRSQMANEVLTDRFDGTTEVPQSHDINRKRCYSDSDGINDVIDVVDPTKIEPAPVTKSSSIASKMYHTMLTRVEEDDAEAEDQNDTSTTDKTEKIELQNLSSEEQGSNQTTEVNRVNEINGMHEGKDVLFTTEKSVDEN